MLPSSDLRKPPCSHHSTAASYPIERTRRLGVPEDGRDRLVWKVTGVVPEAVLTAGLGKGEPIYYPVVFRSQTLYDTSSLALAGRFQSWFSGLRLQLPAATFFAYCFFMPGVAFFFSLEGKRGEMLKGDGCMGYAKTWTI